MGTTQSLQDLPDVLTEQQVRTLCGVSFPDSEFKALSSNGCMTKNVFLDALSNKTDVFLTHDWGKELGQDNHARVGRINELLKERGLTTWFDDEKMEGNVKKQMANGIDNAQCIIVFITKRYIDKVGGMNAEDNCQLEFNYAARRKTARKMIPVVMEERVRDTGSWDGEVGLVLGGRLYVDMAGDISEENYANVRVNDLYSKIIKIIHKPVKGITTDPSEIKISTTTTETNPTSNVQQNPFDKDKNFKPLMELTVDDVGILLSECKLSKFVDEMRENDVDGPTLLEIHNEEELKELGITVAVKARMFLKKLEDFKLFGVPFSLLRIPEMDGKEKEETIVECGDGSFSISGATGGCANRINGQYEISEDMQNGLPVYAKVGDSDTFIELVHGASGWRWYLKPADKRGPDSSVCFAYAQCQDEDMKLASHIDGSMWYIYDKEFVVQSTVEVKSTTDLPPPANITQLLNQVRLTVRKAREEQIAEEKREPLPGSFQISGATGKNAPRVNGVFEPTKETQNGFPVYRKKADGDTWVEIVYSLTTGWRWYLKPTANKGPDSSVCFAYSQCIETDIKLPQDTDNWQVNADNGFEIQTSCVLTLASQSTLPPDVVSRYKDGLLIASQKRENRIAEENRGIIAGTFRLSGATGKSESRFNGVYEPSSEVQNNFPVYRKKGDPDTWIELVHGNSGWRWYLKPTENKGPESSICYAYFQCPENEVLLPSKCTSAWFVHTSSGFVAQQVTVKSESDLPLPPHLQSVIAEGESMIVKQYEDKVREENRTALPGSFRIEGATGKVCDQINGTYEPTIESQNGFPVYKKKGDDSKWVEMVFKDDSGWRWYIKPTQNKGPDSSVCFAYAQCNEYDIKLPPDETDWYISTNDGFVFQKTVKLSRPGGPDTKDVVNRYEEGKGVVLRKRNERYAKENSDAIQGAFRIEGAAGKVPQRINGVYEPTSEVQNCMPVYRKKGDPNTWIELVCRDDLWRWYLKPTANKGNDSIVCFSYFTLKGKDVKLPVDCKNDWCALTSDGFKTQSSIKLSLVHDSGQPDYVVKLLKAEGWKKL